MVRHTGEDLVNVKGVPVSAMPTFQMACIHRTEFNAPESDRFPGDDDALFGQEVFDVAMAQVESIVEPDVIGNDIRRESMSLIGIHLAILPIAVS